MNAKTLNECDDFVNECEETLNECEDEFEFGTAYSLLYRLSGWVGGGWVTVSCICKYIGK